jgi:hypothetical protein
LQFIKEGGTRLRAMFEEARRLGAVATDEQVAAAARYRDAVDRIGLAWTGVWATVVEKIGPGLADTLNRVASAIAAIPEIVANTYNQVAAALGGDGAARARVAAFWESLKGLVRAGMDAIGVIVLTGLDGLVAYALGRVWSRIEGEVTVFPYRLAALVTRAAAAYGHETANQMGAYGLLGRAMSIPVNMIANAEEMSAHFSNIGAALQANSIAATNSTEQLRRNLNEWGPLNEALKQSGVWIGDAAKGFWDATDAVTGFRLALGTPGGEAA